MVEPKTLRRFWKNPVAVISLLVLVLVVLSAILGPLAIPAAYGRPSALSFSPPTLHHPFGTDLLGQDLLYRVLTGGRVSLLVGFCGAIVSLVIGTAYGLVAGYAGGRLDGLMMRIVDILYSVPRLVFILIAINAFNQQMLEFATKLDSPWLLANSRIVILIVSLGIIEWLTLARIVRGQTLALKDRQFVTAAKALGQSHFIILWRHILPNLLGVVLIYLTLTIPAIIIDESFLSFLGLGVQPPAASWGSLLADGAGALNPVQIRWWLVVFPAVSMAVTLLALNYLGDSLRDLFDPKRS